MPKNFLIYDSLIAKQLLKKGYKIVDIALNYKYPNKLVFYFKYEGTITEDFKQILEEIKKTKELI